MKHPNSKCQKQQDDFLKQCPEEEREFHAGYSESAMPPLFIINKALRKNKQAVKLLSSI